MRSVNMMELSQATIDRIEQEQTRYPNPRGALIEALHLARTEAGTLSMDVLTQIAGRFNMRPAEVAEVASFYSLLTLPPARAVLQVCTGLPCCLRGARSVVEDLERKLGTRAGSATSDGGFAIVEVECLGSCATAPVMQVNLNSYLENVTPQSAASLCDSPDTAIAARRPAPIISCAPRGVDAYLLPPDGERCNSLDAYQRRAGYRAALDAARMKPADLRKLVEESGLRGRGGAGFVTGRKWAFMPPKDGGERYLAINSDESEPGTFKDRQILERNPHLLLEGILIAGHAIEADAAYIYVRGEYADAYANLRAAIAEAYRAGILGERALGMNRRFQVHAQRGAGAYICGEETGMLESMEGKKGQPRKRPPFPALHGLWGRPTTVNNVETVSHLPAIIQRGAAWFREQGAPDSAGHTLFGVSGHVRRPGVFELPLGVSLRELIYEHAGGPIDGRAIKAIIPGGVSMPVLHADQMDVSMSHDALVGAGTMLGTGGVIVMDDRTCMVRAALVVARFFEHESCGQCTQCREGTGWITKILRRLEAGEGSMEDLALITDNCFFMDGKCICALADGAAWSARGFLTRFRGEFEQHVRERRCPFEHSFKP
jgi:NADH-quinone oxidoreductase subunit F